MNNNLKKAKAIPDLNVIKKILHFANFIYKLSSSFPKNNFKFILQHFKITHDNVNIEHSFKFSCKIK